MTPGDEAPTYYYQTLTVGDPENCLGICTLWTPQEKIARSLSPQEYGRIGNLYSRDGINHIVRNVLADPVVRYIVICGVDLTGSGEAFLKFARDGVDRDYRIVGDAGRIEREIPRWAIEEFRQNVRLIDKRGTTDAVALREVFAGLPHLPPFGPPRFFPRSVPSADTFPSEGAGISLRGKRVADVWLRALASALQFGDVQSGPFGRRHKDLVDLILVVDDEDSDRPYLPSWLPITAEYLEAIAYPLLLAAEPPADMTDTEGTRLFNFAGIDQLDGLVNHLAEVPASHSAAATLWMPGTDLGRLTAPNLLLLQFRRRGGRLFATAYLRSVDIYRSWPEVAFSLRRLQRQVCSRLGDISLGTLTTVLHSAHIADADWDLARDVVAETKRKVVRRPRKDERDPRGSFVVRIDDGAIRVAHYSRQGVKLQEFSGSSAAELALMVQPYISQIDHAIHIGSELQKAEIALTHNDAVYLQDHPLRFDPSL